MYMYVCLYVYLCIYIHIYKTVYIVLCYKEDFIGSFFQIIVEECGYEFTFIKWHSSIFYSSFASEIPRRVFPTLSTEDLIIYISKKQWV